MKARQRSSSLLKWPYELEIPSLPSHQVEAGLLRSARPAAALIIGQAAQ